MDKAIPLSKSTTSPEIISPTLHNMSITEPLLLKNVLHLFHKKDNMLISTFESHVFLLTKYVNIQKIIPSIFNSSAHKLCIAHTIITFLIILILLIIPIKIQKISKKSNVNTIKIKLVEKTALSLSTKPLLSDLLFKFLLFLFKRI